MPLEGDLDYALARIHARHGARPREAQWRMLEASRDLAHHLEALRSSSLAPWCSTLEASADTHAIERALRARWRRYVDEVASWHPENWRPWLAWVAWVPLLPLLDALARPEPAPPWMLADPLLGPLALGAREERGAAVRRGPLAPLAETFVGRQSLATLWKAHWDRLLPPADSDTRALLRAFLRCVDRSARALSPADDSAAAREVLASELAALFRASGGTALASLCHLALIALDLERLRGGLARRRLFAAAALASRPGFLEAT
jgi:hypothetical protein